MGHRMHRFGRIAREADGRENAGGGGWHERAGGAVLAGRGRCPALCTVGAVPAVLRHDNLSPATHELRRSAGRQLTVRCRQVLDHYGLRAALVADPAGEAARERRGRAVALPDEDGPSSSRCCCGATRDFDDEAAYLRFARAVGGRPALGCRTGDGMLHARAARRPGPSGAAGVRLAADLVPGPAAVSGSMLLRRSSVLTPFVVHVRPVGVTQPDYGAQARRHAGADCRARAPASCRSPPGGQDPGADAGGRLRWRSGWRRARACAT